MPYRSIAADALREWREAVTITDRVEQDSPEWREAYIAAELARQRYHEAVQAAQRDGTPLPPPFPDAAERRTAETS